MIGQAPTRPSLLTRLDRRARAAAAGEDGFALIFALMLIFIIAALSIGFAGIVYNQVQPTQYERKDVATIDAAQAGLQVSLGQIRSASTTTGTTVTGQLTKLQCTGPADATFTANNYASVTAPGVTYTGTVNTTTGNAASAGNSAYSTSVAYYLTDPSHHIPSWLSANAMACPLTSVPNYAYLQTHGSISGQATKSGDRTVHATYQFNTTNTNVAGGRLIPLGSSGPQLCLDTGTGSPAIGSTPTMQACKAIGSPSQSWSYRNDLTLFYDGAPNLNLCLQAGSALAGAAITLQTCTGSGTGTTYPYAATNAQQLQEWPFNDDGHFATAGALGGVNGTCLDPTGQSSGTQAAVGTAISVVNCDGVTYGLNAWNPDPQVGAGKAGGNTTGQPGAPTNQFVNYAEFGRCLDITGQNVNADHLIDYPCKQAPDSSQLTFNQVWTYTASATAGYGTMSVNYGGTKYCLTEQTASNMIVTQTCATPSTTQLWQTTGQLNSYASSYELVSLANGQCMAADNAYNSQITDATAGSSTIVYEPCDSSLRQKWNAPPVPLTSTLGNIGEDTGTANN